jgi:hypothetical protein
VTDQPSAADVLFSRMQRDDITVQMDDGSEQTFESYRSEAILDDVLPPLEA